MVSRNNILFSAAGLAAGILIGMGMGQGGKERLESQLQSGSLRRTTTRNNIEEVSPEPRASSPALATIFSQASVSTASNSGTVASPMQLAEIQKQKLATVRAELLDAGGKVATSFIRLFDLSEDQAARLQAAVDQGKAQLAQSTAQNAKLSRSDQSAMVVTVAPFDASKLYEPVMDAFASVLGREKYGAFTTLLEGELSRTLNNFGAEKRTITITRSDDPTRPFQIIDNRMGIAGAGTVGGGGTLRVRFNDEASIPAQYRWLGSIIGPLEQLKTPTNSLGFPSSAKKNTPEN